MRGMARDGVVALVGVLLVVGVGCGSDWTASCGKTQPCGGDVVGSWVFNGACTNEAVLMSSLQASCPGATIHVDKFTISGTMTLGADQTFTMAATRAASARESIPLACQPNVTSCAELSMSVSDGGDSIVLTCTGTTTCDCTVDVTASGATETGTYTTSGTTFSATGGPGTVEYCRAGSLLHLIDVETGMNMGAMGQVVIGSDIVAQKK